MKSEVTSSRKTRLAKKRHISHDFRYVLRTSLLPVTDTIFPVTMRLRLTVKRHGLPDAPIVWTVESETTTISKLLEEVHDAIPIESRDWGFEDYAVELKGANGVNFECLHYQTVGKVFKEDDEVM